jgi:putative FmdB family regulatory protein
MPLYSYNCPGCGKAFEAIKSVADRATAVCPSCSDEAKQAVCAPTIALDGTDPGFPTAYDAWAKKHERAGRKTI